MTNLLDWLLEPDNPSARYLALTGLLGRSADDPEVQAAQAAIPGWGPAKAILNAQWPEGYWMHPGLGYSPRHKATVWQVIFLAQLGTPRIEAVDRACAYLLDHSRLPNGLFAADKTAHRAILCLSGSLLRAFSQLGYQDPRLEESLEALAQAAVGSNFRCRCQAGLRPPRHRDGLPCPWGAAKTLNALAGVPAERRSPAMQAAIEAGLAFLLSEEGPLAGQPDALESRLSFPLDHHSDLLELLEVSGRFGVGSASIGIKHGRLEIAPAGAERRSAPGRPPARTEASTPVNAWPQAPEVRLESLSLMRMGSAPRLEAAMAVVRSKRDENGRWPLEHTPANTWASFGTVGQPNKWVTLRALAILK